MTFRPANLWEPAMAAAMLLALATQLRIAGSGIGAALLLVALTPAAIASLWWGPDQMRHGVLTLLVFWGLLWAAISLGSISSIVLGVPVDVSLVLHDIFAYALLT